MPALYFINKLDKSSMTNPKIFSITAIHKNENGITVCFGLEYSSASEGVRPKQNELSVSVRRVDLKLVKRALYLSGSSSDYFKISDG